MSEKGLEFIPENPDEDDLEYGDQEEEYAFEGAEKPTKEGVLWKHIKTLFRTKWEQRYVLAFEGECLKYFHGGKRPARGRKSRREINLRSVSAIIALDVNVIKRNNAFQMTYTDEKGVEQRLVFAAETKESCEDWIRILTPASVADASGGEGGRFGSAEGYDDSQGDKYVRQVFSVHSYGADTLEMAMLPGLLNELGVGDITEEDKALLDPKKTGKVHIDSFLEWYWTEEEEEEAETAEGTGATADRKMSVPAVTQSAKAVPGDGLPIEVDQPEENIEWNEQYQMLLDKEEQSFEESIDKGLLIASFLGRFRQTASRVARVIIEELVLPTSLKSIPPLSEFAGSTDEDDFADHGHQMFFAEGLLFRVVSAPSKGVKALVEQRRRHNLQLVKEMGATEESEDVDESALHDLLTDADVTQWKVANHELHALSLVQEGVTKLHQIAVEADNSLDHPILPVRVILTCLVDYLGMRVCVLCLPPIKEEETLVFGRLDENSPFVQPDPLLSLVLNQLGEQLNFKKHQIAVRVPPREYDEDDDDGEELSREVVAIPLSVHTQVHHCEDGRYYLMNLARLFPPDQPEKGTDDVITRLLRPEFVQHHEIPLSSDSLTPDGRLLSGAEDRLSNDSDALKASQKLLQETIPEFIKKIDMLKTRVYCPGEMVQAMHDAGINLHHLGRIAELTRLPHMREMAVVEMIARAAKVILNRNLRLLLRRAKIQAVVRRNDGDCTDTELRTISASTMRTCHEGIVELFNAVLGPGFSTQQFWTKVLIPTLCGLFHYTLPISKRDVHKVLLFSTMQRVCGVSFVNTKRSFDSATLLRVDDLDRVVPRVKLMENRALECYQVTGKANDYAKDGKFDMSLQAHNLLLALWQASRGENHPYGARILRDVALVFLAQKEVEKTVKCIAAAKEMLAEFDPFIPELDLILLQAQFMQGDEVASLKTYDNALIMCEYHYGDHHPLSAEIHAAVSMLYSAKDLPETAILYQQRAYDLAVRILGPGNPVVANYSRDLGNLFFSIRALDKAVQLYERCLLARETCFGSDTLEVAEVCYLLATCLTVKGDLRSGHSFAEKGVAIRELKMPPLCKSVLDSLRQLAQLSERLGNLQQATVFYDKLLKRLKRLSVEVNVEAIQDVTRSLVAIRLRALPVERRAFLRQVLQQTRSVETRTDLLQFVIGQLFQHSPAKFTDALLAEVGGVFFISDEAQVTGWKSSTILRQADCPPLRLTTFNAADQLAAVTFLTVEQSTLQSPQAKRESITMLPPAPLLPKAVVEEEEGEEEEEGVEEVLPPPPPS